MTTGKTGDLLCTVLLSLLDLRIERDGSSLVFGESDKESEHIVNHWLVASFCVDCLLAHGVRLFV